VRFAVLVMIVFAAAANAAEPQLVPIVRVPTTNKRTLTSPAAPAASRPAPSIDPTAFLEPLVRMSAQERANAMLVVTADAPEVKAAVGLWNRGEFEPAIAALQDWARRADLRRVRLGFNWRVPIQTPATDWGANVRVGVHDSAYLVAFDRNNATGNLVVFSVCYGGDLTRLKLSLSTDAGLTWNETYSGLTIGYAAVTDLELAGSGGFEYAVFTTYWAPDSASCARFDAATGNQAMMPDSTPEKIVLSSLVHEDTIKEVSVCTADDQYPGSAIYVIGGTAGHSVVAGYSYDQGASWGTYTAVDSFYWGGLDYCYNPGERYVLFSCLTEWQGNLYPGLAFYDTMWHMSYYPVVTDTPTPPITTDVAVWYDTLFLVYPHTTATGTIVRCVVSYDAYQTISRTVDLTDSSYARGAISACARLGDGVSVVYRQVRTATDRRLQVRRSDYTGENWTGPDPVSEYLPARTERARIQRVAPGLQGVCYICMDTTAFGTVWYNRSDWLGVVGAGPGRTVPTGLVASPHRGGARLSFVNPVAGPVTLKVYDATGRRVRCRTEQLKPGAQTIDCVVPASGSYIAVLKTAAVTATTKFSTLK